MKKILLSTLLFITCSGAYAQSYTVTIINHSLFEVVFRMHATGSFGCNTGDYFDIGSDTLIYTPCSYQTAIGWTLPYSTVCPSYPASFQWSDVDFQYLITGCGSIPVFQGFLSDATYACLSGPTSMSSGGLYCPGVASATWVTTGGSGANITITFN